MGKKYWKVLDLGTISAGGSGSASWTADNDYIVNKMWAVEVNDESLSNVTATIKIAEEYETKDAIPLSSLGQDLETSWKPKTEISKGQKISITAANNYSTSRTIKICLEIETKA